MQPSGDKNLRITKRDCVPYHQGMRGPRALALKKSLLNIIRQLKGAHPDFDS
jgi:hypothetical protein